MNILFMADKVPYPIYNDGGTLMTYNVMKFLNTDNDLDFISFHNPNNVIPEDFMDGICNNSFLIEDNVTLTSLDYLKSIVSFKPPFYNKKSNLFFYELKKLINNNKYDLIFIDGIHMDVYASEIKHSNKIISLHDSLSLLYLSFYNSSNNFFVKSYFYYCSLIFKKVELQILKNYRKCLFVSNKDVEYLKKNTSNKITNCFVIQNGVNQDLVAKQQIIKKNENALVFTGVMDYKPNVDAVMFFVKEIFPLILINHPKTIFFIVGKNPSEEIKLLKSKNIIVTGFVDDISGFILNSCVYVSPLLSGAGLKNKILEAMALRIPIVSTSISLHGINVEHNKHIFVKDNPTDFAKSVSFLLDDEKLRNKLIINSYDLILKEYTWEHVYSLYNKILFS